MGASRFWGNPSGTEDLVSAIVSILPSLKQFRKLYPGALADLQGHCSAFPTSFLRVSLSRNKMVPQQTCTGITPPHLELAPLSPTGCRGLPAQATAAHTLWETSPRANMETAGSCSICTQRILVQSKRKTAGYCSTLQTFIEHFTPKQYNTHFVEMHLQHYPRLITYLATKQVSIDTRKFKPYQLFF